MKHGLAFQKSADFPPSNAVRTGLRAEDIKQAFLENLFYGLGRVPAAASLHDAYMALALTVRDRVFRRSVETAESAGSPGARLTGAAATVLDGRRVWITISHCKTYAVAQAVVERVEK